MTDDQTFEPTTDHPTDIPAAETVTPEPATTEPATTEPATTEPTTTEQPKAESQAMLGKVTETIKPYVDMATETVKPYADKATEAVKPYADKVTETVKPYVDTATAKAKEQASKIDRSKLDQVRVDLHLGRLDVRDEVKSLTHDTVERAEAIAKDVKDGALHAVKLIREGVGLK